MPVVAWSWRNSSLKGCLNDNDLTFLDDLSTSSQLWAYGLFLIFKSPECDKTIASASTFILLNSLTFSLKPLSLAPMNNSSLLRRNSLAKKHPNAWSSLTWSWIKTTSLISLLIADSKPLNWCSLSFTQITLLFFCLIQGMPVSYTHLTLPTICSV